MKRENFTYGDLINGIKYLNDAPSRKGIRYAIMECECGNEFEARVADIKNGKIKSCGCLKKKQIGDLNRSHGILGTHPLYQAWINMKSRCYNQKRDSYKHYGGRGITVCDEWLYDFKAFYDFMMGLPYALENGYTIDRINTNGNYTPENMRWADVNTQRANRRTREQSKTGFTGVHKRGNRYYSVIGVRGEQIYLGRFSAIIEAAEARNNHIIKHGLWEYPIQNILVA